MLLHQTLLIQHASNVGKPLEEQSPIEAAAVTANPLLLILKQLWNMVCYRMF